MRCKRVAFRISKLKWKMGKKTSGKKRDEPHPLKSNKMARGSFQPTRRWGMILSRIAGLSPLLS